MPQNARVSNCPWALTARRRLARSWRVTAIARRFLLLPKNRVARVARVSGGAVLNVSGQLARGEIETGRRGKGNACWRRLALGAFGLFWVAVILYFAS